MGIFPILEINRSSGKLKTNVPKMERTVKVIRVNNPLESKFVTPAAVQYLDTKKWRLAEPMPTEAKKKDAEGAVIKRVVPSNVTEIQPEVIIPEEVKGNLENTADQSVDPKEGLRTEYKEKSGKEPDGRWNEARLKIEISKLEK